MSEGPTPNIGSIINFAERAHLIETDRAQADHQRLLTERATFQANEIRWNEIAGAFDGPTQQFHYYSDGFVALRNTQETLVRQDDPIIRLSVVLDQLFVNNSYSLNTKRAILDSMNRVSRLISGEERTDYELYPNNTGLQL
ncbi:MAG: hypothetical protein WCO06_07575 [Candidatus Roizmanbacteria bacterium]